MTTLPPSPTSSLGLHESPGCNQRSRPVSFLPTLQVPQKTANQSAERPSQIQSILHILPDGRRRGELAMVNRESHPSGQIPERALPPDETNRRLP